ncbi:hypothetical protein HJG60_010561 [Phyllostomus discolor]|uniref:Uncharacterized protein n=1 Tax=Phyllostomus discolor TaxID=89673 RepID=A0A834EEW6_9CHIR|nr:hypothetical protein HJG60_010561 [Phyllostomus discolor]
MGSLAAESSLAPVPVPPPPVVTPFAAPPAPSTDPPLYLPPSSARASCHQGARQPNTATPPDRRLACLPEPRPRSPAPGPRIAPTAQRWAPTPVTLSAARVRARGAKFRVSHKREAKYSLAYGAAA